MLPCGVYREPYQQATYPPLSLSFTSATYKTDLCGLITTSDIFPSQELVSRLLNSTCINKPLPLSPSLYVNHLQNQSLLWLASMYIIEVSQSIWAAWHWAHDRASTSGGHFVC